jgi:hypothetical protein
MYLLRSVTSSQNSENMEQCHFTRFLSLDLGGSVSKQLSNVISSQQAAIPKVITDHLSQNEPSVDPRYRGLLTNETVTSSVIRQLKKPHGGPLTVPPQVQRPPSPQSTDESSDQADLASKATAKVVRFPSLETQAFLLLAPVLVYWLMVRCQMHGAALLFSVSSFVAIRQVVLCHIGDAAPSCDEQMLLGPVTCRFVVELKGVLRYIANKKEEREEWKTGSADVSVVHIVASALARALVKEPALRGRRVVIPWLLINRVIDASSEAVDVSISENGGGPVTLKSVDGLKIQDIANCHAAAEEQTNSTEAVGQCMVLSSSSYGESEMVTDAAPVHRNVSVVAILGGVHLEHPTKPSRASGEKKATPRPVLSMSLTITRQQQADIVTCRRFAGEVRKLLAYPEMCDSDE